MLYIVTKFLCEILDFGSYTEQEELSWEQSYMLKIVNRMMEKYMGPKTTELSYY